MQEIQKSLYDKKHDIKNELGHKVFMIAGGNWKLNDKDEINSYVMHLDTINSSFPSRALKKKKQNTIAYHNVQEAIAVKV
jgi:hypothetical protein